MLTIMIAAHNAEHTIVRAIKSCIEESYKILLIDDHSTDDTVAKAEQIGGRRLRVIHTPEPGGVSIARQTGLEAVRTPFAAWLDADDEWLPRRADRILKSLNLGFDIVTDSIELHDGPTGRFLRRMEVPFFLRRETIPVRLFERNYLPGDTQVGFRTKVFCDAGGYDPKIFGSESFDLLLRAIAKGATFGYLKESGYRIYAYPGSVSRNLPRMLSATAIVLKKHSYDDIYKLCRNAGYTHRVSSWVLVSMATFRTEYNIALEYLEQASPCDADPQTVLEPDGPLPFPEGWRRAFFRGSLLLSIGDHDQTAAAKLNRARSLLQTAEGDNNLGVALARLGRTAEAMELFAMALKQFPKYLDAELNLTTDEKNHITKHPIRRQAARFEYELRF
jgi:glycosyltransferase involved in cell wall biosynthesis